MQISLLNIPRYLSFRCFLFFVLGCFCVQNSEAQIVLYMEVMTEIKPIKYYEGQMISLKTNEFPDDWQTFRIQRVMEEGQTILHADGMIKVSDIIEIRRSRGWVKAASIMLKTFGTSWLFFGSIAHVATDTYDFGVDTAVIGGGTIITGILLKKAFQWKKYKIGKKVRLKILDISWPEPRG